MSVEDGAGVEGPDLYVLLTGNQIVLACFTPAPDAGHCPALRFLKEVSKRMARGSRWLASPGKARRSGQVSMLRR